MNFSTSDWTMLRIRCQKCGQHTEKIVTVLVRKDAIPCGNCGARIGLSTPTNKILIAETAASCDRIGEALIKGLALPDVPSQRG
jgi:formate dehydrogenase maturation protein FdhE